jgi:hypothetical protein
MHLMSDPVITGGACLLLGMVIENRVHILDRILKLLR